MRRKSTRMGAPSARGGAVQGSFVIDLVLSHAFTLTKAHEALVSWRLDRRVVEQQQHGGDGRRAAGAWRWRWRTSAAIASQAVEDGHPSLPHDLNFCQVRSSCTAESLGAPQSPGAG